ncbi:MAG: DNA polymerase III subunit beta [Syntrophorhabdaceae bacterium]|nr:DNA polymerase III subunit beta [Syntrophorhabdaceae bacterium]
MANTVYSFEKNKLLKPISQLIGITGSKASMPVLSNVLLEFSPEGSRVTATNLETSAVITLDVTMPEHLKFLVHARKFTEMIRELDNDNIEFTMDGQVLDVRQKQTKYTIALQDIGDYPEIQRPSTDKVKKVRVRTDVLKAAFDRTEFAAARDETRLILNGIFLSFAGKQFVSVATDGFRMACYGQTTETGADLPGVVVPRPAVGEIRNIILAGAAEDIVMISASGTGVVFETSRATLICRQIEGEFPDYKGVIPTGNERIITVNRDLLLKAVRKVASISERNDPVQIAVAGETMDVLLESGIGRARENVPVAYSGPELNVNMNIKYLFDVLQKIPDDNVIIGAPAGYGGYVLKGLNSTDYVNIIMPIKT